MYHLVSVYSDLLILFIDSNNESELRNIPSRRAEQGTDTVMDTSPASTG